MGYAENDFVNADMELPKLNSIEKVGQQLENKILSSSRRFSN